MRVQRGIVIAVSACCAIIIALLAGLLRPLGDVFRVVTIPVARIFSGATISATSRLGISTSPQSTGQIVELEQRLSKLAIDYVKLSSLEEENRLLRAQAKFLNTSGFDSVGARVISREIGAQRAMLIIDRGLDDRVEKGQAVITGDGIFIGKISTITEHAASIDLLADPDSRVTAAILGENKLMGIIEGRGNGAAVLTYIPSSEHLKRDQIIITAGTEEKIPPNLPLGIINSVSSGSDAPFFTAAIEPLIPGDQVTFVSVLRPSASRP